MSYRYVVNLESGTYFDADHAVLIENSAFDIDEYNTLLDSGSDSEIIEIAKELGRPVVTNDAVILTKIAQLLSEKEWDSDVFNEVADLVRQSGRDVNDISEE
jgi:hypothetical protein